MNHIYNESGERIIASGSPYSPVRIKEQYNLSFPKALKIRIDAYLQNKDMDEKMNQEIVSFWLKEGVPKGLVHYFRKAVEYYFNEKYM
jgi:hypothetical protein